MQTIRLVSAYGTLKRGQDYKVVRTGSDYVVLKAQGKVFDVPKHMIQTEYDRRREIAEEARREERSRHRQEEYEY